mgnify:CR=1 FL=1
MPFPVSPPKAVPCSLLDTPGMLCHHVSELRVALQYLLQAFMEICVPRILIIDDDYQIRLALRKHLEMSGYTVEEALDGNEGIALFREHPADLVILDIMMPGKDGFGSNTRVEDGLSRYKNCDHFGCR